MTFDIEIAARTLFGEARGEIDEGRLAVAWVLVNRLNAKGKWYSAPTLAGVCLKREQFSCWNPTDPNYSVIANLPETDQTLTTLRFCVMEAVNKMGADPTGGAVFYHADTMNPFPAWASQYTRLAHIGHQIFYRD